jgi:signal transduction histidine kinase
VKGELALTIQPLDVNELIENYLPQNMRKAEVKGVQLEITIAENLPQIQADRDNISWVISQLLDNAIKFTPAGGQVNLSADKSSNNVEFRIKDSGIGIPGEQLGEIFKPFHQLDGSVTRRYPGTGLGLAMVHQILKAHGASIKVTSNPGEGTLFTFALPAASGKNDG